MVLPGSSAEALSGFVIELPFPPSVNSIWRVGEAGRGRRYMYLAPAYAQWKREADQTMRQRKLPTQVKGHFDVWITLDAERRRGDADNYSKAVLDYLQRIELIENDKLADMVSVAWGHAPVGCSVVVLPAGDEK